MSNQDVGTKHDAGKAPWHLVPWPQLGEVVAVLRHGAELYAPNNWQRIKEPQARYFAAAMRHMVAWERGEKRDPESGLPHLAHAVCSLLFLLWFDGEGKAGNE